MSSDLRGGLRVMLVRSSRESERHRIQMADQVSQEAINAIDFVSCPYHLLNTATAIHYYNKIWKSWESDVRTAELCALRKLT